MRIGATHDLKSTLITIQLLDFAVYGLQVQNWKAELIGNFQVELHWFHYYLLEKSEKHNLLVLSDCVIWHRVAIAHLFSRWHCGAKAVSPSFTTSHGILATSVFRWAHFLPLPPWGQGQGHTQHIFNYRTISLLEPFHQWTKPIVQCKVQTVKHELK